MRVIISGCRNARIATCGKIIDDYLATLPSGCTIIHGNCKGVDLIADVLARKRGMNVIAKSPDWKTYGKAAGPMRNIELLNEDPDLVVCFHSCIEKSKGTRHMKTIAEKKGIKTLYFKIPME